MIHDHPTAALLGTRRVPFERRAGLLADAFGVERRPTMFDVRISIDDESIVLTLRGELDLGCCELMAQCLAAARLTKRPIAIDLGGLTFIDLTGGRLLESAVDAPSFGRLFNTPASIVRVLRQLGLGHLLGHRTRTRVGLAICELADPREVARLGAALQVAPGGRRGSVIVEPVMFDPVVSDPSPDGWCVVVVPPLCRWMGISRDSLHGRWMKLVTANADHVVCIGTGAFLLAAAGRLDGRDVSAGRTYGRELAAMVPRSRLHYKAGVIRDREVSTVSCIDEAVELCSMLLLEAADSAAPQPVAPAFR